MISIPKLIQVAPKKQTILFLRYSDGTQGEVDVSFLAKGGAYQQLNQDTFFAKVHVGRGGTAIIWNNTVDADAFALYLRLKNLDFYTFKKQNDSLCK